MPDDFRRVISVSIQPGSPRMSSEQSRTSYVSLFDSASTIIFFFATFLGRVPLSMRALGCVLLIQQATGSYSLAGLVGAVQTLVAAFASPQLGRLTDRYGDRPVLFWTMLMHVVGMVLLIVAALGEWHWAFLLLGATLLGGSSVPFGSLSRAFWVGSLGKGPRLDKAYAMEAMADETGFVIGPLIVVPLAVSLGAEIALLVSMAVTVISSLILILQRRSDDASTVQRHVEGEANGPSVMSLRGMQVLAASLIFMGLVFGSVEIVLVAFAEANDWPGSASIMASTFALGSLIGAIVYGAINWRIPVDRRLKLSLVWFTVGTIPMFLSNSVWQMTLAVLVTGLAISPCMIATNSVVEGLAPHGKLTEAFSWVGSALATGAAVGSMTVGVILDELGLRTGQGLGVIAALVSVVIVFAWARYLQVNSAPIPVS
jgi:MFS family permease